MCNPASLALTSPVLSGNWFSRYGYDLSTFGSIRNKKFSQNATLSFMGRFGIPLFVIAFYNRRPRELPREINFRARHSSVVIHAGVIRAAFFSLQFGWCFCAAKRNGRDV
jgi:hypothetical protein